MVRVTSEIGRLRSVLVHEPGPEVDRMVPAMMEELLFDDILFGERAREEHRRLRRVLQLLGVEVVDAGDLLLETLATPQGRAWVEEVNLPALGLELRALWRDLPSEELAEALVCGRRRDASLGGGQDVNELWAVPPIPNWCFQRDPQVVIGDGVVFGAMATPARFREALLARAIFRFHPTLSDTPVLCDPLQPHGDRPFFLGLHRPRLEGGDVLVLSRDVVMVGISERTNTASIPLLARSLSRQEGGPRYLLVAHLPERRAYMHLDTVMTPIDRDAMLVHAPVVLDGPEQATVYELDLHAEDPEPVSVGTIAQALTRRGLDLEPVPCGGNDPVDQQREQWTDGANAMAVAPGVILLYDRNVRTAEALDARGFRVVEAEDLLLGGEEIDMDEAGRTCILLSSHEISRARGGPHCLTHPLVRDDV